MSEIKFHKANALPSPLDKTHDGVWFTEGMGGSFKMYIISGGVPIPLNYDDTETYLIPLTDYDEEVEDGGIYSAISYMAQDSEIVEMYAVCYTSGYGKDIRVATEVNDVFPAPFDTEVHMKLENGSRVSNKDALLGSTLEEGDKICFHVQQKGGAGSGFPEGVQVYLKVRRI